MTAGPRHAVDPICPNCQTVNVAGDRFCGRCATSLADRRPEPPPPPVPVDRDDTTRYLCAAAHLDPRFADRAVAEYLVEDVRAVPPSPGLNSASVLREAVAARSRRRTRDVVLLLLLLALLFTGLPFLLLWLLLAIGITVLRARSPRARRARARRDGSLAAAGVVVLVGVVVLPALLGARLLPFGLGSVGALGLLVVLGIVVVIGLDATAVHVLVRERFARAAFRDDARALPPGWERALRTMGLATYDVAVARVVAAELSRARAQDGSADVVVHRGSRPFVGSGVALEPQVVALPLKPAPDADPVPIDVLELHDHITAALRDLRSSVALTPGGRLASLADSPRLLIPADRLVLNMGVVPGLLDHPGGPPATTVPSAMAEELARRPAEWARYYRSYSVEAWDRDLTMSCHVYAGTDERMMYLEWTHCVLTPLRPAYRDIDRIPPPGAGDLTRAALDLVLLPFSVADRIRGLTGPRAIRRRPGEVIPERYGAHRTLRELAADEDVQTYFQQLDVLRYVRIIDTALFRSVGRYLEDRGYSVVEFQEAASHTITNNSISVNGGTFIGSTVGAGTVSGGGSTRTGAVGTRR